MTTQNKFNLPFAKKDHSMSLSNIFPPTNPTLMEDFMPRQSQKTHHQKKSKNNNELKFNNKNSNAHLNTKFYLVQVNSSYSLKPINFIKKFKTFKN